MALWNYCVPLTIITVACLVRTGKARNERVNECDVNEKSVDVVLLLFSSCKFALKSSTEEALFGSVRQGEGRRRTENTCRYPSFTIILRTTVSITAG